MVISPLSCYSVIVLGSNEPHPYQTANNRQITVCVLTAPPTQCSPISLPLLWPPYSLRHDNIEIRPVDNPTVASKCSSERKSQSMGQTSLLSYFKRWSQAPQPSATTILSSLQPSPSRQDPPPVKKLVCWRLRWWWSFIGNKVFFLNTYIVLLDLMLLNTWKSTV